MMVCSGSNTPGHLQRFLTKLLHSSIFLLPFFAQCQGETAGAKGCLGRSLLIQLGADEILANANAITVMNISADHTCAETP